MPATRRLPNYSISIYYNSHLRPSDIGNPLEDFSLSSGFDLPSSWLVPVRDNPWFMHCLASSLVFLSSLSFSLWWCELENYGDLDHLDCDHLKLLDRLTLSDELLLCEQLALESDLLGFDAIFDLGCDCLGKLLHCEQLALESDLLGFDAISDLGRDCLSIEW